jgi:hypothetical protein
MSLDKFIPDIVISALGMILARDASDLPLPIMLLDVWCGYAPPKSFLESGLG